MSLAEELGFDFSKEGCIQAPFSKFPCRKCIPCLLRRQKAWVSRLVEELSNHDFSYFVTLTYDDEHLPIDENGEPCFNKRHFTKLNADLRKRFQLGKLKNPVYDELLGSPEYLDLPKGLRFKYYLTTEYGPTTFRPHAHGVWYGLPGSLHIVEILFRTLWPYGFVSVFPATEGAAGYISKYLVSDGVGKDSYHGNGMPVFSLMSKSLGLSYVERMGDWHRSDPKRQYVQRFGSRGTMDRYLKHKIFTDEVLDPISEKLIQEHNELRTKYAYLSSDNPVYYKQVLKERAKYFNDMEYSLKWSNNKKKKIK